MRGQKGKAHDLAGHTLIQQFVHGHEIAERFRHLSAVDGEEPVVHPKIDEASAAMRALALRQLVFMVREDQIDSAAVDVETLAEMRLAHRRALDMPARPAASPGALPTRLVGVRRLP